MDEAEWRHVAVKQAALAESHAKMTLEARRTLPCALLIRAEALQWTLAQRLLTLSNTVIVEWGAWGRWERDRLRLQASALGAAVELHYLAATPEELYRRIQLRGREDPPIEWATVQQWSAIIEPPDAEEFTLFDPPLIHLAS